MGGKRSEVLSILVLTLLTHSSGARKNLGYDRLRPEHGVNFQTTTELRGTHDSNRNYHWNDNYIDKSSTTQLQGNHASRSSRLYPDRARQYNPNWSDQRDRSNSDSSGRHPWDEFLKHWDTATVVRSSELNQDWLNELERGVVHHQRTKAGNKIIVLGEPWDEPTFLRQLTATASRDEPEKPAARETNRFFQEQTEPKRDPSGEPRRKRPAENDSNEIGVLPHSRPPTEITKSRTAGRTFNPEFVASDPTTGPQPSTAQTGSVGVTLSNSGVPATPRSKNALQIQLFATNMSALPPTLIMINGGAMESSQGYELSQMPIVIPNSPSDQSNGNAIARPQTQNIGHDKKIQQQLPGFPATDIATAVDGTLQGRNPASAQARPMIPNRNLVETFPRNNASFVQEAPGPISAAMGSTQAKGMMINVTRMREMSVTLPTTVGPTPPVSVLMSSMKENSGHGLTTNKIVQPQTLDMFTRNMIVFEAPPRKMDNMAQPTPLPRLPGNKFETQRSDPLPSNDWVMPTVIPTLVQSSNMGMPSINAREPISGLGTIVTNMRMTEIPASEAITFVPSNSPMGQTTQARQPQPQSSGPAQKPPSISSSTSDGVNSKSLPRPFPAPNPTVSTQSQATPLPPTQPNLSRQPIQIQPFVPGNMGSQHLQLDSKDMRGKPVPGQAITSFHSTMANVGSVLQVYPRDDMMHQNPNVLPVQQSRPRGNSQDSSIPWHQINKSTDSNSNNVMKTGPVAPQNPTQSSLQFQPDFPATAQRMIDHGAVQNFQRANDAKGPAQEDHRAPNRYAFGAPSPRQSYGVPTQQAYGPPQQHGRNNYQRSGQHDCGGRQSQHQDSGSHRYAQQNIPQDSRNGWNFHSGSGNEWTSNWPSQQENSQQWSWNQQPQHLQNGWGEPVVRNRGQRWNELPINGVNQDWASWTQSEDHNRPTYGSGWGPPSGNNEVRTRSRKRPRRVSLLGRLVHAKIDLLNSISAKLWGR